MVAGGPNENPTDPVAIEQSLLSSAPAARYVDDIGSWSTNEITINWNAPLAWVTAFIDEHQNGVVPERTGGMTEDVGIQNDDASAVDVEPQIAESEAGEASSNDNVTMMIVVLGAGLLTGMAVAVASRGRYSS